MQKLNDAKTSFTKHLDRFSSQNCVISVLRNVREHATSRPWNNRIGRVTNFDFISKKEGEWDWKSYLQGLLHETSETAEVKAHP